MQNGDLIIRQEKHHGSARYVFKLIFCLPNIKDYDNLYELERLCQFREMNKKHKVFYI